MHFLCRNHDASIQSAVAPISTNASEQLWRKQAAGAALLLALLSLGGCAAEGVESAEGSLAEDVSSGSLVGHPGGPGRSHALPSPVRHANRQFCPASSEHKRLSLRGVELQRVDGIPLEYDGFNNIEGPLWHDRALYYTNMGNRSVGGETLTNQTTLWRWEPGKVPTVWLEDTLAGTNGLAVDFEGRFVVARQLDGSISEIDWNTKAVRPIAAVYEDKRFNSPNDLTIAHDNTIYFSDPNWNTPSNVDPATVQGGGAPGSLVPGQRIYRIGTDGIVWPLVATELVPELRDKPNGLVLSLDERQLVIGGLRGLWVFDLEHGQTKNPRQILTSAVDGLGKDCAGNLYITTTRALPDREDGQIVLVLNRDYEEVGYLPVPGIHLVTNVAFGGRDGKTLFVTGLTDPMNDAGTAPRLCGSQPCLPAGIYSARLNVPGFPY